MRNLATSQERITRIWKDASKPKQQQSYGEYSWKTLILKVPTQKQEGAEGTRCKETHTRCLCMAWLWSGSHYHPKDKLKSLLPKMFPNCPCDLHPGKVGPCPLACVISTLLYSRKFTVQDAFKFMFAWNEAQRMHSPGPLEVKSVFLNLKINWKNKLTDDFGELL